MQGKSRVRESANLPHSPLTRIRKRSLHKICTIVHGKVPVEKIGKSSVVRHATDAIEGVDAIGGQVGVLKPIRSCPHDADAIEGFAKGWDAQGLREEVSLVDFRVDLLQVVFVGAEDFV